MDRDSKNVELPAAPADELSWYRALPPVDPDDYEWIKVPPIPDVEPPYNTTAITESGEQLVDISDFIIPSPEHKPLAWGHVDWEPRMAAAPPARLEPEPEVKRCARRHNRGARGRLGVWKVAA